MGTGHKEGGKFHPHGKKNGVKKNQLITNKYEKITEKIAEENRKRNEGTGNITQIRSARLRERQDPDNPIHRNHTIEMIDLNNDKVFDIKFCKNCQEVLMNPEAS